MPKYHELINPLLQALHELGGSGSVEEISSRVSEMLGLPEEVLAVPHDPGGSSQSEVEYRLARTSHSVIASFGPPSAAIRNRKLKLARQENSAKIRITPRYLFVDIYDFMHSDFLSSEAKQSPSAVPKR